MLNKIVVQPLSTRAIEVIGWFFVNGPIKLKAMLPLPGAVTAVRELDAVGLVMRTGDFAALSLDGLVMATEWDRADLKKRGHLVWLEKLRATS